MLWKAPLSSSSRQKSLQSARQRRLTYLPMNGVWVGNSLRHSAALLVLPTTVQACSTNLTEYGLKALWWTTEALFLLPSADIQHPVAMRWMGAKHKNTV